MNKKKKKKEKSSSNSLNSLRALQPQSSAANSGVAFEEITRVD